MKNAVIALLLLALLVMGYLVFSKHNEDIAEFKKASLEQLSKEVELPKTAPSVKSLELKEHHHGLADRHTDEKVPESFEEGSHSHDVKTVRQQICKDGDIEGICNLREQLKIAEIIIDKESGAAKSLEIGLILQSQNFSDVQNSLIENRTTDKALLREEHFKYKMYDIGVNVPGVLSNGITCGDVACVSIFTYTNSEDWNQFSKQFFSSEDNLMGSLFIAHQETDVNNQHTVRVLFLPENRSGVIQ